MAGVVALAALARAAAGQEIVVVQQGAPRGGARAFVDSLGVRRIPVNVDRAAYRELWRQVEECSGRRRDFGGVRWYAVYAPSYPLDRSELRYGGDYARPDRITLAIHYPTAPDDGLVRHEMLHAILDLKAPVPLGDGTLTWHPPEFFVEKCGSLVT